MQIYFEFTLYFIISLEIQRFLGKNYVCLTILRHRRVKLSPLDGAYRVHFVIKDFGTCSSDDYSVAAKKGDFLPPSITLTWLQ